VTAPTTPLLECRGIEKSFFGVRVLKGVGFALGAGETLGIVGENGAGKSTLMNVLGGVLRPDRGEMGLGGRSWAPRSPAEATAGGVAFVHQELNLFPNLTVAENVFLHALPRRRGLPLVDRARLEERTRALLAEVDLDVSPRSPLGALGPGPRQLVEIAKALAVEARVVIFDEPTTSLSAPEVDRLFALLARLRARGRGLLYISHALKDVLRLSDRVVVLRDGEVVGEGPRAGFDEGRLVSLMVGRTIEAVFPVRTTAPHGESALEARGLTRRGAFRDVSFTVRRGEVLGLGGLMGAGRTEVVRALFGLETLEGGEIRVLGRALDRPSPRAAIARGMALVTEDRRGDGLLADATVAENLALVSLPSFAPHFGRIERDRLDPALAETARGVRLERPEALDRSVRTLSGGNQQKVVLGKWLLARPTVLVLDEPTRGVDVGAKTEIYRLIVDRAAQGAAVVLVSSEIEELVGLCDRILVLRHGKLAGAFDRSAFDRQRILRVALGATDAAGTSGVPEGATR
jgi:ABC-type sugar transport system ATPase subunit